MHPEHPGGTFICIFTLEILIKYILIKSNHLYVVNKFIHRT